MKLSPLVFTTILLLSGCSGTYQTYYHTLKLAFSDTPNAEMSAEGIQKSEVDLISVKRGTRAKILMALAYLEDGQHKWVSADNAMLIMEKGRIVRTLGLDENLLYLSNLALDPLKSIAHATDQKWSRIADWSGDEYGYQIDSVFNQTTATSLSFFEHKIDSIKYTENVLYTAPSEFIRTGQSWQNSYWIDKKSGTLIKSIQTLSPNAETIEILYLSRMNRIVGAL